jgi:hypothetical protein
MKSSLEGGKRVLPFDGLEVLEEPKSGEMFSIPVPYWLVAGSRGGLTIKGGKMVE